MYIKDNKALNLGKVKWIVSEFLCLLKGHDLDFEAPGGEVSLRDVVIQVSDGVVWVVCCKLGSFICHQILDALVTLHTNTD